MRVMSINRDGQDGSGRNEDRNRERRGGAGW